MNELIASSAYFGVVLSLGCYMIGQKIKQKTGLAAANPLLIAVLLVMLALHVFDIDYAVYNQSSKLLSALLTPATICLAVPLYEQLALLKKHKNAILAGIAAGVLTSLVVVFLLSLLFRLDHQSYVTLLPKSITSAIGMGISEELGGYASITVVVIIMTGILGNVTAEAVCRLSGITEPIARGVAIGTSSHAIGTARAMEIGQIEGAMSSLSIVVSGLLTVIGAPVFAAFL